MVAKLKTPYPGPFRLARKHPELQVAYILRNNIKGFETNTTFRDPSSPIKIGDTYHIWFTKTWGGGPVGQQKGSQDAYQDSKNNWKRFLGFCFSLACNFKGWLPLGRTRPCSRTRTKGSFDDRCVFTPDILVANGKYYLYYQVAQSPHVYKKGPHHIAMAWSDSPYGPWKKHDKLILSPSKEGFILKKFTILV